MSVPAAQELLRYAANLAASFAQAKRSQSCRLVANGLGGRVVVRQELGRRLRECVSLLALALGGALTLAWVGFLLWILFQLVMIFIA